MTNSICRPQWAVSLLAFVAVAAIAAEPPSRIRMRAGTIDTEAVAQHARTTGRATDKMAATPAGQEQARSSRGTRPYLVQFSGPVEQAWKDAVRAAGGTLCGYMPDNAYVVEMTEAVCARVAAIGAVGWIGEFSPAYKYESARFRKGDRLTVTIRTFAPEDIAAVVTRVVLLGDTVVTTGSDRHAGRVRATVAVATVTALAQMGEVHWIEPFAERKLFNDIASQGARMNARAVWTAGLTGTNQVIGHADTGLDTGSLATMHPDFTNRIRAAFALGRTGNWNDPHGHGTHTAGSILGSGVAAANQFRGIAYGAELVHQAVMDAGGGLGGLPTPVASLYYQTYTNDARIHSDSWGAPVEGQYTDDAQSTDQHMWDYPDMLIIFAAGNEGYDGNRDGVIDLVSIGSPGTAKNVLTVGAAENARASGSGGYSSYAWGVGSWAINYPVPPISTDLISTSADGVHQGMAAFSSRGPCVDGRNKPDIVAPGTDIVSCRSAVAESPVGWGNHSNSRYAFMGGTSMACPLAAGAAALTRQYLMERRGFVSPSAALVKALMLNGARSLTYGQYGWQQNREVPGQPRPNNVEGWGQVNLYDTLFPPAGCTSLLHDATSLSTGQSNVHTFTVAGTRKLCVSLAWTDYPGTPGAVIDLVNDLDLLVTGPDGAVRHPNGRTAADRRNNVEGMDLDPAPTGTYSIVIHGANVPSGPQPYALVIRTDVSTTGARCTTPESLAIVAEAGTVGTAALVVSNDGGSTLSVALQQPGYVWQTSDDAGGPAYDWQDISSNGTAIVLPGDPDDGIAGPYSFGFPFPFFGRTQNQFRIGMNGAIVFQSSALAAINTALPAYTPAGGIVAPFWNDLDCAGCTIKYASDGTNCIVTYFSVPQWNTRYSNTFQVIFRRTGDIVFQYKKMDGRTTRCTIGIQDTNTHAKSIQAAYHEDLIRHAFAIQFVPNGTWLSYGVTNFGVSAHSATSITLSASASGLTAGVYTSEVTVQHSGFGRPRTVSVVLSTGLPFLDITTTPATVTYDAASIVVAGTNNPQVTGTMWATNLASGGAALPFAAGAGWRTPPVELVVGTNEIVVYGRNAAGMVTNDTVVIVRGVPGTGVPFVAITNNAPIIVPYMTTTADIGGSNNANVVDAWWTNHTTAASGIVVIDASTSSFTATVPGLAIGPNRIHVLATNIHGAAAEDGITVICLSDDIDTPWIAITNGVRAWTTHDFITMAIAGTNSNVLGAMWWTNRTGATGGELPASDAWALTVSGLVVGVNEVYVYGTNQNGSLAGDVIEIERGGIGTGMPFVDITNVPPAWIDHYAAAWTLGGSNNFQSIGHIWWTNLTTGSAGPAFRADGSDTWTAAIASLAEGDNVVRVMATNLLAVAVWDEIILYRVNERELPKLDPITGATLREHQVLLRDITGRTNVESLICDASAVQGSWFFDPVVRRFSCIPNFGTAGGTWTIRFITANQVGVETQTLAVTIVAPVTAVSTKKPLLFEDTDGDLLDFKYSGIAKDGSVLLFDGQRIVVSNGVPDGKLTFGIKANKTGNGMFMVRDVRMDSDAKTVSLAGSIEKASLAERSVGSVKFTSQGSVISNVTIGYVKTVVAGKSTLVGTFAVSNRFDTMTIGTCAGGCIFAGVPADADPAVTPAQADFKKLKVTTMTTSVVAGRDGVKNDKVIVPSIKVKSVDTNSWFQHTDTNGTVHVEPIVVN